LLSKSSVRRCVEPPIRMSLSAKDSVVQLPWRVRNTFLEFPDEPKIGVCTFFKCSKRSASADSDLARWICASTGGGHNVFKDGPFVNDVDNLVSMCIRCEGSCRKDGSSESLFDLSGAPSSRRSAGCLRTASSRDGRKFDLDNTVMIRHIACRYTEQDVRQILDEEGLAGTYHSVHVPESFSKGANRGYAFVTFFSPNHVEMCKERLSGRKFGCSSTEKLCQVSMAHTHGSKLPGPAKRQARGLRRVC